MNVAEYIARSKLKIRNLQICNTINDYGFPTLIKEELADPNKNILVTGTIDYYYFIHAKIDIEFFKEKDERSPKSLFESGMMSNNLTLATEQDKENQKFKWVYIFGAMCGYCYFIGRLPQKEEFSKHALRVFRGFWHNGGGIEKYVNDN